MDLERRSRSSRARAAGSGRQRRARSPPMARRCPWSRGARGGWTRSRLRSVAWPSRPTSPTASRHRPPSSAPRASSVGSTTAHPRSPGVRVHPVPGIDQPGQWMARGDARMFVRLYECLAMVTRCPSSRTPVTCSASTFPRRRSCARSSFPSTSSNAWRWRPRRSAIRPGWVSRSRCGDGSSSRCSTRARCEWTDVPAEPSALPVVSAPAAPARPDRRRDKLVRRAKALAWIGLGWHGVEAAIAIGAGVAAGSIALIGFGADSLVEAVAGVVVLWRLASSRAASLSAERRAQQLIAISFYAIALYIAVDAIRALVTGDHPDISWVGIGLSAVTLVTMPPLAIAKARVAEALGSSATRSESRQTMLCAYLSAALLVGLGLNAMAGWWWADPAAALLIAAVAFKEGRESWRGESCCTAPALPGTRAHACEDDCCR